MQELRDAFLNSLKERFDDIDLDEVYEILREFKKPFELLAQNMDGQNEYSSVTEPWSFDRLDCANRNDETENIEMLDGAFTA